MAMGTSMIIARYNLNEGRAWLPKLPRHRVTNADGQQSLQARWAMPQH
jgi:hypothetical protein